MFINLDLWDNFENVRSEILFGEKKKIIGWGTGSLFRYYHFQFPIKLEYLIDNNYDLHGKEVYNIPVYSPDRLLQEDSNEVIILVYSSFYNEISAQIKKLGDYKFIPIGILFDRDSLYYNKKIYGAIRTPPIRNTKINSEKAILVQGPVIHGITQQVLKYYAALYPEDLIILSTWGNTDEQIIDNLTPYVDYILLNDQPINAGVQNRNYQIVSTYNGLIKAAELGVKFILKTRTDIIVLNENILQQSIRMLNIYHTNLLNKYKQNCRIIVPENFTRKYLLYHPSDLVMFGHISDLLLYWGAPLDNREMYSLEKDYVWLQKSLREISLDKGIAESYLGLSFCTKIGRNIDGTLLDSWNFYRDHFIVVDNNWFDLFWFKSIQFPDLRTVDYEISNINHYFWQQLYFENINIDKHLSKVDIDKEVWGSFIPSFKWGSDSN